MTTPKATKRAPTKRAKRPAATKPPTLDPVTRYATDVCAGVIVAGRAVRLACRRHLNDLARQRSDGFPYHFDAALAQRVADFFKDLLRLEDGRPFILQDWQHFILGSIFGWVDEHGLRRFRTAYDETGKGSGKTPIAAGVGLYGMVGDGEHGAEIYSCGVTRDQASYLFRYAKGMAEDSPDLRDLLGDGITEHNIAWHETRSFFRPLSSEGRGLDNKRPHMSLIDEVHEHPSAVVVDKMRAGTKGRRQALQFLITNSGYDRQSVCYRLHDYSLKVLEGSIVNETWFAYICQLDPCTACEKAGHRAAVATCSACDRWDVEGPHWLKANPNLGVSLTWQYLREQVEEAKGMPTKQNIVRRLNFCEWTEAESRWIDKDAWSACGTLVDPVALQGKPCYGGLDLASSQDVAALALVFPSDDGSYDVLMRFWVPREGARVRSQRDRVEYERWIESEAMTATEGNVTDYDVIREDIRDLAEQYQVQSIAYDRWGATQLVTQLTEDGAECVPVGQGFASMSAPAKEFERLVVGKQLRHGGDPVLAWMAGNVVTEQDAAGNIKPSKRKSTERIDGIVALVMALSEAMRHNGDETSSPYEEHGVTFLSF